MGSYNSHCCVASAFEMEAVILSSEHLGTYLKNIF